MRLLGEVQEVGFDGRLIVRGHFTPNARETVFDNRKRVLGRTIRVFGPVSSPYVSVETSGEHSLLSVVGRQVYIEGEEHHGKGSKRRDG
jgi:rRNA processing protein Gar1